ncbi:hypothetical protein K7X08_009774 [Anisodus acutangulus]|uniref:Vacuolar iron transporter n=1 Tax=Anisodus acutangulus TaxID=402998 RepID=A0A9Q1RV36_9SOLA|nr:hypothetical protein K7X08_009774 [Anisodus acutangulus]
MICTKFIGACVFSAVALALLGIAKAKIAGQNYALSAGITLFNGLVAGAAAYVDVLVLGFANLLADGISKGFGDYMSSRTQSDVAPKKRSATEWDVINQHRPQKKGLLQQYQALGMDVTDAKTAKIAGQSCLLPAVLTLCNGAIAGAAAYGIGWTLRNVAWLED